MIQLEVDTREEEGWQEEVEYLGQRYVYHEEKKTWPDAEAHCQSEGGHLASVLTREEQKEVRRALLAESYYGDVWLGGSDRGEEGVWQWTDASPWSYTDWRKYDKLLSLQGHDEEYGKRGSSKNCLVLATDWEDRSCTKKYRFICKKQPTRIKGTGNLTLQFTKKELKFSSFSFQQ